MRRMLLIGTVTVGLPLALPLLTALFVVSAFNAPPFPLERLDQLSPGMTQADVKEVLGPPSERYDDSWVYSRSFSWPLVRIYFDDQGQFSRSVYDY